jgi:hypothetical protein
MKKVSVRLANNAFINREYETALLMYKHLAKELGETNFKLNIDLCKKRLDGSDNIKTTTYTRQENKLAEAGIQNLKLLDKNIIQTCFFPDTGNKIKSYIREATIQSNGNLTFLGEFYAKHKSASTSLIQGIAEGINLRKIINKKPVILIAGHDLRFVQPFIDYFGNYFEVLIDKWSATNQHDSKVSMALLKRADLIWCEWCCGNAVWYSNNISSNQKLIVRLHKFEIETSYPSQVIWNNVQSIIFIAEGMRRFANERHNITCKQYVLYNGFDVDKVQFSFKGGRDICALAVMGFVPYIKRLDKAIDFFEIAWQKNKKISLHLKGNAAEELSWVWQKQQEFFKSQNKRITELKGVGATITQESYDERVHSWLGQKGFILSVSDIEGSHQSVAESMACGTIPIIFGDWVNRYQARKLYPSEFCFNDLETALAYTQYLISNPEEYQMTSQRCLAFAHENFNQYTIAHGALSIIEGEEPQLPYIPISNRKKIAIFTDLCINIIDGSSIWLMSVVELLLSDPNIDVLLISREACKRPELLKKFNETDRFKLESFAGSYSEANINDYIDFLCGVLDKHQPVKTIVRAVPALVDRMMERMPEQKINSLIYYLIGEAYPKEKFLTSVAAIFVQTEESKRRLADKYPACASKKEIRILRPMIPDDIQPNILVPKDSINIAYTGKLSEGHMALEMLNFVNQAPLDIGFTLCVAKFHRADGDDYIKSLRKEITSATKRGNVIYKEGLTRAQTMTLTSISHVGWSIRNNAYKDSSEISTKVLEYCSLGKPVLLNRFDSNVTLLGESYPLYVDTPQDALTYIYKLKNDELYYRNIASHCIESSNNYRMSKIYDHISDVLQ